MNAERIALLLNNYAALLKKTGVPERLQAIWNAAERCAGSFDPAAEDLPGMIRALQEAAAPAFAHVGSAQPLNGLLCLAEKDPALLSDALLRLLADDGGDLALRQAMMQAFCQHCNERLALYPEAKRTWAQNIRATMNLLALIRPEDNFLYKSTEARYVADMVGCTADVSSGALFSLAGYHGLAGGVAQAIASHPVLSGLVPADGALPPTALRNLMAADILLNAGPKKLGLFGEATPLVLTRSRTGQAAQERAVQVNVLQLQLDQLNAAQAQLNEEIAALPAPDLVGQRFTSPAFGTVTCLQVQGSILTLETAAGPRRMSQPECFLNGFLLPEDAALVARYEAERALLRRLKKTRADAVNLLCSIRRLQSKP